MIGTTSVEATPTAERDEHRLLMLALIAGWTTVVAGIAVWRVWGLEAKSGDLGFIVHALAGITRGGLSAPASWAGWSLLEDHFSPILVPLAPLAATRWGGYWLVIFQAVMAGWAVWWAWKLTRRAWLTVAYATAPAIVFPLFFDFHANIAAIPFVLMAAWGFRYDTRLAVLGGSLAALCREDVAAVILLMGLFHSRTRAGKQVATCGLIGLVGWWFTHRTGRGYGLFYDWVDQPARMLEVVWADGLLVLTAVALLLPWTLFELDWRYVTLAGVASLPYLLADSPIASTVAFHYWALPVSLMLAAVKPGRGRSLQVATVAVLGIVGGPFASGLLGPGGVTLAGLIGDIQRREAYIIAAHEAVRRLPDAAVAVPSELTPHTGHLAEVYILPHPFRALTYRHGYKTGVVREPLNVMPHYTIGEPPVHGYENVGGLLWELADSRDLVSQRSWTTNKEWEP